MRGFSRGGIWFITAAACSDRAVYLSASDRSLICSSAPATICGTPIMSARLNTPPSTLTFATRGSRRNQTGCDVPPHGSVDQDRPRRRDRGQALPEHLDVERVQARQLEADAGRDLAGGVHLRDTR